jgi:hypothetical protein
VRAMGSAEESAKEILEAVESVLPELAEHSTDEVLRTEWLAGVSPGLVAMQRLLYLTILVNEIGPAERLGSVLEELRSLVSGSVHAGLVEGQLVRAGVRCKSEKFVLVAAPEGRPVGPSRRYDIKEKNSRMAIDEASQPRASSTRRASTDRGACAGRTRSMLTRSRSAPTATQQIVRPKSADVTSPGEGTFLSI